MIKKEKKRIVLLDAHAIIHRAYHALPEFVSSKGEPTGALYGLSSMLIRIISDLKPDYLIAAYDLPGKTFRHEAYEGYKALRPKAMPDLISQLKRSRDIFSAFGIPIYDQPGFEADDILGTIVKILDKNKDIEIIIASGDMDTMQLINGQRVQVYTLKKGLNDTIMYDQKKVIERFGFGPKFLPDYKGLRGDPSDNIPGIPGIGEKTATILIQNFGSIEDLYRVLEKNKESFKKVGLTDRVIKLLEDNKEEAIFSKTLAQIRSDVSIDFKLSKESWRESWDIEKVKAFFKELEFKSLIQRLEKIQPVSNLKVSEKSSLVHDRSHLDPELSASLEKIGLALWLLDSSQINPGLQDILNYAETDSLEKAQEKILIELKKQKLEKIYKEIELPLLPIIKKAEEKGILLDTKYLTKLGVEYQEKLKKIEEQIYKLAGKSFNLNSPLQLAEILFDHLGLSVKGLKKTAGGGRSTRESELIKLRDLHPIIEKILRYRELQKILSTYVLPLPKLVDAGNRLHTHLNQAGTTTGRMSSSNPNLQNIPVHGDYGESIRKAFVTTPGYKWIASDYSQIEMRVLALFSEDERLINVFKNKEDVHSAVASFVFGVPESEVTPDQRRKAKTINFGIIYGMGVNALKESLGTTRAEAQSFYDNFFETFPKIRQYFEKVKKEAVLNGYTETLFGRRRYFPGIKSKIPYLMAMALRMAMNAPLQGTAADIIKIAIQKIEQELKENKIADKVFLLLAVHDELIYEAEEAVLNQATEIIKRAMENAIESRLPFTVNVSVGDNWAQLEKQS